MMANRVQILGRVAQVPELKYTASGVAVTDFRIAVDRQFKAANGEREADFFTVKVWRDQAERIVANLTKGQVVIVDGRIEERSWIAQDGTKKYATEIIANTVAYQDTTQMMIAVIAGACQTVADCFRFLNRVSGGDPEDRGSRDSGDAPSAYGNRQSTYGNRQQPTGATERQPAAPAPAAASDEPDYGDPFADQ